MVMGEVRDRFLLSGYAAGSAAVQIVYCLALARAYDHGELSQIYPLARGSAPMLVAIGAALSAGEWPSAVDLMGLALVSAGILALSLGRERLSPAGMVSALFVGSCIAGYMILDGLGVRFSRNPASYIAWMTLAQTLPMPLVYRALRRTWPILRRDRETLKGFAAGLLGLGGYAIVVWAMSMTQMARVSGLRETSILFATLIGVIFLNEPFTVRRSISSLAITAGVICLAAY